MNNIMVVNINNDFINFKSIYKFVNNEPYYLYKFENYSYIQWYVIKSNTKEEAKKSLVNYFDTLEPQFTPRRYKINKEYILKGLIKGK